VTFTLKALIANSGNVSSALSITVRFYDGNPSEGGTQIGSDQVVLPLPGCGGNRIAAVEWTNVPTGTHSVYVSVDSTGVITESDELNNLAKETILVATHRAFLPATQKASH
jgi:hypothetical protein